MNDRNVYSDLRRALVRERKYVDHMKLPEFASLRENYFVQAGSFLGRELADYHQILTHNGALDFVQYGLDQPQPNLTIVDLGCGAGYVLCDLREYFPKANLVGFDIQDQTRTIRKERDHTITGLRSEDLFAIFGVDYINDNYLNIRDYLPGGFDIAVAVGGFYDRQYSPAFCFAVLNRLYRLANTNGIIQVELNHTTEGLGQILEALETQGTPFTYTPATEQGLARHALWHEGSEDGVLTIGPKL